MKEENTFKLLVEGNDDQHVVWSLCQHHSIPKNFDVIDCENVNKVFRHLKLRLQDPEKNQRIAVMIDADQNLQGRFESFLQKLSDTGKYDCSHITLPREGLIMESTDKNYPKIGLWIMPNNNAKGMLEDFVVSLATLDNAVLMDKAEDVLAQIEEENIQRYKPVHRTKAKIHTFLAWQDEPGKPMGQAITAHMLDADTEQALVFVEWLKKFFA